MSNNETQNFNPQDIQNSKGLACISYIGFLFIIPMLINKDSAFTKFHVNQGIVFFIFAVICSVISGIVGWIPVFGWIVSSAIGIALLVMMILGITGAAGGEAKRLPIIGNVELYK